MQAMEAACAVVDDHVQAGMASLEAVGDSLDDHFKHAGEETLQRLTACDWDHATCPTLDLEINGITASTVNSKTGGRIMVRNSDITSMTLDSSGNGAYVLDALNTDKGLNIKYHQAEKRVSLRSYGASLPAFDVRPTWEDTSKCSFTGRNFDMWRKQFDQAKDGTGGYGCSGDNFEGYYNTATCCGAYCPVYSACRDYNWALFPESTNNFRTFSDLASEITRLNFTQVAPWAYYGRCRQFVNMNYGSESRTLTISGH